MKFAYTTKALDLEEIAQIINNYASGTTVQKNGSACIVKDVVSVNVLPCGEQARASLLLEIEEQYGRRNCR